MSSRPPAFLDCPAEVFLLILEELNDIKTLGALSRVNKSLRRRLLPNLLRSVDLSSHNAGRLPPGHEDEIRPKLFADFDDDFRPLNLVTRQRAFLWLITNRPDLASLIESFTWTLIWIDFDEEGLSEIDYELWNVFSCLTNVRQLDLASIHQIGHEPFIRRSPSRLFPAVTNLRLLGWMHRGLVDAIISSLDPTTLHTLRLDYLQDEGAFPNGAPMVYDFARDYAHRPRNVRFTVDYRHGISEELYERQRNGAACVFPGPMWTALRTLSGRHCTSLTQFCLKIPAFDSEIDIRNYLTCWDETAKFLLTINKTLKSLTVVFGESRYLYDVPQCGTARVGRIGFRLSNIAVAAALLRALLKAFRQADFPSLVRVTIQGLHILDTVTPRDQQNAAVDEIRELVKDCPILSWEAVIGAAKVDYHPTFAGYDYRPHESMLRQFQEIAEES